MSRGACSRRRVSASACRLLLPRLTPTPADDAKRDFGRGSKAVGKLMKEKKKDEAQEQIKANKGLKEQMEAADKTEQAVHKVRHSPSPVRVYCGD